MNTLLTNIRDWTEVWSLIIPLFVILRYRDSIQHIRPVIIYVFVALILNLAATTLYYFHDRLPDFLGNNNILYNLHSIARVAFFSWYIIGLRQHRYINAYKFILIAYALFIIINFIFFGSIFIFSSAAFTAESIVLLLLSLSFFIGAMQDDSETNWLKHPAFLVCTAVCLYEAVNFFIFLFFYPLFEKNVSFGKMTMTIHHFTYTAFCILIALALYRSTLPSSHLNSEPART